MDFHGPRTQILVEKIATDETVIVYTVPVEKEFHLVEAMLRTDAGATGEAEVGIRDENDVHVRHICNMDVRENNKGVVPADHFEPAFAPVIPAGYDIVVISDSASLAAQCDLFGFETPAQP